MMGGHLWISNYTFQLIIYVGKFSSECKKLHFCDEDFEYNGK